MKKRYVITIITALLIVFVISKSHFQELETVYGEIEFSLEHDYTSLASILSKSINNNNKVSTGSPASNISSDGLASPAPDQSTPFPANSAKPKPTSAAPKKNYNLLLNKIKEYLATQEGTYGIYFLSLTNGQTMGLNAKRNFIAASTIKVPINLYLYTLYSENRISLDETVTYLEEDYEEGTGSIQYEDFGNEYNLRELSRRSIVESDNVATKMLSRYLDYKKVVDSMDSLVNHATPRNRNATSPNDMTIYLKSLLDLSQSHEETQELLDFLLNTDFNDRIPLYLPPEVPVAHKIGNQARSVHDAGIVFASKPYILSIYSEDVDEETAPEVIAQISIMVYDFSQN